MGDSQDKTQSSMHTASMVDLKAELYRKQEDVKRLKLTSSSYVRGRSAISEVKTKNPWSKKDAGVLERAQRDLEQREEEEDSLEKSKRMLEKKAKMYTEMTNSTEIPEEDGSRVYLVDFQRKVIDKMIEKRDEDRRKEEEIEDSELCEPQDPEDQWVDYTDSLGRTRTCLHKDLAHLKQQDRKLHPETDVAVATAPPTLMSRDMERELQRQKWEEEAREEMSRPVGPIHYANIQHGEVRTHGVGFYQFSKDEDTRQEQLKMLNTLREQTVNQRAKREKLMEKRKAALDARLAKVRQRRLDKASGALVKEADEEDKESALGGDSSGANIGSTNSSVDQVGSPTTSSTVTAPVEERAVSAPPPKKPVIREWDRGKRPEMFENIEKMKERLENERPEEFAPPSFYYDKPRTAKKSAGPNHNRVTSGNNVKFHQHKIQDTKPAIGTKIKTDCMQVSSETDSDLTAKDNLVHKVDEIPLPPDEIKEEDIEWFLKGCRDEGSYRSHASVNKRDQMTSDCASWKRNNTGGLLSGFDPTKPPPNYCMPNEKIRCSDTEGLAGGGQVACPVSMHVFMSQPAVNYATLAGGHAMSTSKLANQRAVSSSNNYQMHEPIASAATSASQPVADHYNSANSVRCSYQSSVYPLYNQEQPITNHVSRQPATSAVNDTNPANYMAPLRNPQQTIANVLDTRHVQMENPQKLSPRKFTPRDMFSSLYGVSEEDLSD